MKLKVELKKHQVEGRDFLLEKDTGILCYATGTGKTMIALATIISLLKDGTVNLGIFFVTKQSSIEVMKDINEKTFGLKAIEVKSYDELSKVDTDKYKLILIQYQKHPKFEIHAFFRYLTNYKVTAMFDEVHVLKNPQGAKLARFYWGLRNAFKKMYGFTATPFKSSVYDIYYIVTFFNDFVLGTCSEFEETYLEIEERQIPVRKKSGVRLEVTKREVVGYKNIEEFRASLLKVMKTYYPNMDIKFKAYKSDFSNLDAYHKIVREVLTIYDDIFLKRNEKQKSSGKKMVELQYLVDASTEKRELFKKLVQAKLSEGIIVYAGFYETLDILKGELDFLNVDYQWITGQMTGKAVLASRDWFVNDCRNKVLLITGAGGQSLNLQATYQMIIYNIPFGAGSFIQLIGRIVRLFSDFDKFNISFVLANNTIDEYKLELIQRHRDFFLNVLTDAVLPQSQYKSNSMKYLISRLRKEFLWKY